MKGSEKNNKLSLCLEFCSAMIASLKKKTTKQNK